MVEQLVAGDGEVELGGKGCLLALLEIAHEALVLQRVHARQPADRRLVEHDNRRGVIAGRFDLRDFVPERLELPAKFGEILLLHGAARTVTFVTGAPKEPCAKPW